MTVIILKLTFWFNNQISLKRSSQRNFPNIEAVNWAFLKFPWEIPLKEYLLQCFHVKVSLINEHQSSAISLLQLNLNFQGFLPPAFGDHSRCQYWVLTSQQNHLIWQWLVSFFFKSRSLSKMASSISWNQFELNWCFLQILLPKFGKPKPWC